jgi:hypothetical protein
MKKLILIATAVMLTAVSHGQMFAQMFGQTWTPASLSPVAWWRMDGNVLDSGVNNFATTAFNSPSYTTGVNLQAISLNGTNQYASTPDSQLLDVSTNSYTVSAWVWQAAASATANHGIVDKRGSATGTSGYRSYLLCLISGKPRTVIAGTDAASDEVIVTGPSSIANSTWRHVVGVGNRSTKYLYLYVDGTLVASNSIAGVANADSGSAFTIGYKATSSTTSITYLPGAIDDVLFFNRALTQAEITQLYNWRQP